MVKPELLSPAGSLKHMRYAFAYGADAVYAGQPRYSLRVRNNEFNTETLRMGIQEAHALKRQFYVVVNIAPHNGKLKTFLEDISTVIAMKPDALIVSDPGLIFLLRRTFPHIPLHLSVQANTVNWAAVQFWQEQGIARIILSRELALEEIAEIRYKVPDMELEVFVHGALCMAYSGRCLLSGYLNRRDANQGTCTNACRWSYDVTPASLEEQDQPTLGIGPSTGQPFLLKPSSGSGEMMQAFEDAHGTYIMNSKDLCALEHIDALVKLGVHSLKIEGRTKSFYYVARTAQIYRKAIDDAVQGKPFDPALKEAVRELMNRGYTEGFLRRHSHDQYQNYAYGHSVSDKARFVGELTGLRRGPLTEIRVKNRFEQGDSVALITPERAYRFQVDHMENQRSELVTVAPGDGHQIYLLVPEAISLDYGLLVKY